MARLLRHRQTKETQTDTPSLTSTAPHSYSTGPQATLQDRSAAPHLPCLNNTSNGRTGRKAARRYILSLKQEGLRRRHANAFDIERPILSMDGEQLARLIKDHTSDLIVNCIGVLQDGIGSDPRAVHCDFVERLLRAMVQSGRAPRLLHISIPGSADDDRTAFSQTKREAERLIAASGVRYAILRPGFVTAPS